jgi:hypothetical protein
MFVCFSKFAEPVEDAHGTPARLKKYRKYILVLEEFWEV